MSKQSDDRVSSDQEDTGLTMTLRALSERTTGRLDTTESIGDKQALIICTEPSAIKWGCRWFGQSGFACQAISDPTEALNRVRENAPDVVIVEARARTMSGAPVYEAVQEATNLDVPVFVLCTTAREVEEAIDADVCDIARKPIDWQLVSRRAKKIVLQKRRQDELEETRESFKAALDVANHARRQLRQTETFEPVTGLPNRSALIGLIGRGIHAAQRDGNRLGVYAVGFNRFDLLVEALGRSEAESVLAEIGQRLDSCVRKAINANPALLGFKTAAIGIIGTGRFGIMLTCSAERQEDLALRHEIEVAMSQPAVVAGQTVYLSTAVGATVAPDDSTNAENLLIKAESAMRDAKARGAAFRYFCAEMDAAANRRLQIEQMLHQALAQKGLRLAYQPINDVMTGRVVAVEALLRWPQRDGGFINPDEFVPIAEDAGLMNQIGEFVIEEACRQLRSWGDAGLDSLHVAINVAKSQLMDPGFPNIVMRCLRDYDIKPEQLDFELSERGVLSDNSDALQQICELKALGLTISVDDFGTGHSSIAYLKDMPIDILKIDRSYIATLPSEGRESRMIRAIIALARQLELIVIAEGVETSSQLSILQSLGCDQYQGFLCSPAIPADELFELAKTQSLDTGALNSLVI